MTTFTRRRALAAAASLFVAGVASACSSPEDDSEANASGPVKLRLGYFPNLTHATAIVGIEDGLFAKELGDTATLETKPFNAGPAAIEALFSGAIDATYIGPNPTVNGFTKSNGEALRVIAGAASGGVFFVVKPDITTPEQLKGKKIATPQLGNTQDVALRYWLKEKGFTTTKEGGGDVKIVPQENPQTVQTFRSGDIDGAWVPEPYASQLIDAGANVLVDERDLWPNKRFVITNLIVSTKFLKANPDVIKRLLRGSVAANAEIKANAAKAQDLVSKHIGKINTKPLDIELVKKAWLSLEFLSDPIANSLIDGAKHAEDVGLLTGAKLDGLYDLTLLNEVLRETGQPEVTQP